MRAEGLRAIRQPGGANAIIDFNAWMNQEMLLCARKWKLPQLNTRWRTDVTSADQYDEMLPYLIRAVPRDMLRLVELVAVDKSVTPYAWHRVKVIPQQEFDRKYMNQQPNNVTGIPKHAALRVETGEMFVPVVGTSVSRFPTDLVVTSSSASEDSALRVGAHFYTTADRQDAKAETAAAPNTTPATIYAGIVYGILAIGKNALSVGTITVVDEDGETIAELMPHEMTASFQHIALWPYPDRTLEMHALYQRRPPLMTQDSDTTFLVDENLQGAILQGAIARGHQHFMVNGNTADWQAALAMQKKHERDFLRGYAPELIEETHTYIGL